jgi:hypothetical protein
MRHKFYKNLPGHFEPILMEPFLWIGLQVLNPDRHRVEMFVIDIKDSLFTILEIHDFRFDDALYCISISRKIFFVLELLQQECLKSFVDVACTAKLAWRRSGRTETTRNRRTYYWV